MQKSAVIVLVALAAALLCWILGSGPEPAARAVPSEVAAAAKEPVPEPQVAGAPRNEPVAAVPSVRTEAPPAVPALPQTVLCGHCVDEAGHPVAGVAADLLGWGANQQRTDAWRAGHPDPERITGKVTTDAEGAFRFEFWPPPPFQFMLRLQGSGRATISDRWSELQPGSTVDLGAVVMPAGTLLRGRVVDTDGAPVKAEVHFNRTERLDAASRLESWDIGYGKDDGTFSCRWALAAGDYKLDVPHRDLERPKQVTLAGERELVVEVVLRKVDLSAALSGVVVDEQEKPVANAMLTPMPMQGGRGWINSTDREGRFRLVRPENASAEPVSLQITCEGCENLTTQEKFAWGRDDLHLVMRRGLGLEVLVVAAAGGAPVEDFQLYCFPVAGGGSSRQFSARVTGRHEGGRVTVKGLLRQRHHVVVVPKDEALAISAFVPVEIADPGSLRVTVPLTAKGRRSVRVQRADGSAVAGVPVQLTDRAGMPPEEKAMVLALSDWYRTTAGKALLLDKAVTDAHGEAVLSGPLGRALAVQLPGPGHVPLCTGDVMLDVAEPLVITVSTGAGLRGRVTPPEAIAELRRLAGQSPAGKSGKGSRERPATIHLTRGEGRTAEEFPDSRAEQAPVAEDGTFALDGIPPGTWNVDVSYSQAIDESMSFGKREPAGNVSLQDGQTAELAIDLSGLLPGDLDGLVLHNGVPLAKTKVTLGQRDGWVFVTTDAEGRFHATVRPGEYLVSLQQQKGNRGSALWAPEHASVVRGQTTAQTFQIRSATVRLRLLDTEGQPVAGVGIELRDGADASRRWLPATGADGFTEDEIEVEPLVAFVLPRRLQSNEAKMEVWRNNPGNPDPLAPLRLRLGPVLAVAGTTTPLELHLPPEWAR